MATPTDTKKAKTTHIEIKRTLVGVLNPGGLTPAAWVGEGEELGDTVGECIQVLALSMIEVEDAAPVAVGA